MNHKVILSNDLAKSLLNLSHNRWGTIATEDLVILSHYGFAELRSNWVMTELGKKYLNKIEVETDFSNLTIVR